MKERIEQLTYIVIMSGVTVFVCLMLIYLVFGITLKEIREFEDKPLERVMEEYDEEKEILYKDYKEFHKAAKGYGGVRVRMFLPAIDVTDEGFYVSEGIEEGKYHMTYKESNQEITEGEFLEIIGDVQLFPILGVVRVKDVKVESTGQNAKEREVVVKEEAEWERAQKESENPEERVAYYETTVVEVPYKSSKERFIHNLGKMVAIEGKVECEDAGFYEFTTSEGQYILIKDTDYIKEKIELGERYKVLGSLNGLRAGIPRVRMIKLEKQ